MALDLSNGGPLILDPIKSREEKIEEARRSGYIRSHNPNDINPNREQMCCKACGSLMVALGDPVYLDNEKGIEIPYICQNCGYIGSRAARIKDLEPLPDGTQRLVVDLIPDGLVGIVGTMIGEN